MPGQDIYAHGGNIYKFAEYAGCTPADVVDFSSNINIVRPETADYADITPDLTPYPDPGYSRLKNAFSAHYAVPAESLIVFNGGSSAIFALFANLRRKYEKCTLYAPLYSEYKRAASVYSFRTTLKNRFAHSAEKVSSSFAVIVNPSTPDGALEANLTEKIDRLTADGCTVLIDESFIEFSDAESLAAKAAENANLFVLKSMTKFYGSAGIRVGFLVGEPAQCAEISAAMPMWPVSAYDAEYIISSLKDSHFASYAMKLNSRNRKRLNTILEESGLFRRIFPSEANFVLAELAEMTASSLAGKLRKAHIMVRDCSNFDFLGEKFVRFAVKDECSIGKLAVAFEEIRYGGGV